MTHHEILTPIDVDAAIIAMERDGHHIPSVTHFFMDDNDRITGAYSLAYAPVGFFWMRTGSTGLASFRALTLIRHELRERGHARMILPIQSSSPYYGYMQGLGLDNLGQGELFIGKI
jgi:hypothetical protein